MRGIYCRICGKRLLSLSDIGQAENWNWLCTKCAGTKTTDYHYRKEQEA